MTFLDRHARERPAQVAIVDGETGATVRYGELREAVAAIAAGLAERGVRPGDRVAVLALNRLPVLEFYLALSWLGAISVPLNVRHSAAELRFVLKDSGAVACLAEARLAPLAESALDDSTELRIRVLADGARAGWLSLDRREAQGRSAPPDPGVTGDSIGMLLYTSGTTGKPKGCMLPQRAWTTYAQNMAACLGFGAADTYLAFLPLFHVAGHGTALAQLVLGGTVVTAASADPGVLCELVERYAVTTVFVVPGISAAFVATAIARPGRLATLRTFISGAGVEHPGLRADVEQHLGARYFGIYGQTEAGGKITYADSAMLAADPTTYGRALPSCEHRIVADDDTDVPGGQVGELVIRSAGMMLGYWNQPEATAAALAGGWLHTGDLFVQRPNGELRMVDRKKYLIKTGGENVYPQEVETVLMRHPDVADAAVVGEPDAQWGEVVTAYLVPRAGATVDPDGVRHWVGRFIAGYKKPRRVYVVPSLPRNVSGKVVKQALGEMAGKR